MRAISRQAERPSRGAPPFVRIDEGGEPARRVQALTQTLDLMPTIYEVLGLSSPDDGLEGRSLGPLITREASGVHDVIFARTEGVVPCYVVRDHQYVLLLYAGGRHRALYDTTADPSERHNILGDEPDAVARLEASFREYAASQPVSLSHFIDPTAPVPPQSRRSQVAINKEMREELEALGYLR